MKSPITHGPGPVVSLGGLVWSKKGIKYYDGYLPYIVIQYSCRSVAFV